MNEIQSHYNSQEILDILQIKPYFLRFWESEFEQISPITSDSGQKFYTPKDLAAFKKIQELLTKKQVPVQKAKLILDKEFSGSTEEQVQPEVKKEAKQQNKESVVKSIPSENSLSIQKIQITSIINKLQSLKETISQMKKNI